jgi:hypothetical protein
MSTYCYLDLLASVVDSWYVGDSSKWQETQPWITVPILHLGPYNNDTS